MGSLGRRLELIILVHLWVLSPFALAWFLVPGWRGAAGQIDIRSLGLLAVAAAGYLGVRTWRTLTAWKPRYNLLWPYVDVAIITAALAILRDPTDALAIVYFLPLASAVASGSLPNLMGLAAAAVAGLLFVMFRSEAVWSVSMVYRLVIIFVIASVYGWVIRTVMAYERAAERAAYQKELAREIHDGIQYLLATIGARLELGRRLVGEDPERATEIITQERETVRRASDELRYLVRRLRTEAQPVDLTTALRHQVAALADRWRFDLELEVPPRLPRLSPAAEHAVLRVIQESLTNAAKHATAGRVEVRLAAADHTLRCTISDDGAGFDTAALAGPAAGGLQSLRERVASAGGALEIRSAPGQGTTVTATFPIPEASWTRSAS